MKKLKRLLLTLILLAILGLVAVLAYNAIKFSSKQVKTDPAPDLSLNDDITNRLAQAIQIPTISYDTHIDTAAFVMFNQYLDSLFPAITSQLDTHTIHRFSRIYKWHGQNTTLKPILLMAHMDVVPVEAETHDAWTTEPFSGKIIDRHIYGRGTLDMKGSLVGILEAIELLIAEELSLIHI